MKTKFLFIPTLMLLFIANCHSNIKSRNLDFENNYVFFLHNQFLESNPDETFAPEYGVTAEYNKVLESFRKDGFIVFSEKREPKTDGVDYAKRVTKQIDSLI